MSSDVVEDHGDRSQVTFLARTDDMNATAAGCILAQLYGCGYGICGHRVGFPGNKLRKVNENRSPKPTFSGNIPF